MSDATLCECCGRPIALRGHLNCGPTLPTPRETDQRAATDREIVRVVREWYADHDSAIPLAIELEELLEKEGEGTR